jgi:hypothetical protein
MSDTRKQNFIPNFVWMWTLVCDQFNRAHPVDFVDYSKTNRLFFRRTQTLFFVLVQLHGLVAVGHRRTVEPVLQSNVKIHCQHNQQKHSVGFHKFSHMLSRVAGTRTHADMSTTHRKL